MTQLELIKKQAEKTLEFAKKYGPLLGRQHYDYLFSTKDYFQYFMKKGLICPYGYDFPYFVKPEILNELKDKIFLATNDDVKQNIYRVFFQISESEHYDARVILLQQTKEENMRIGLFFTIYSNNPMLSAVKFEEKFDEFIDHDFYNDGVGSVGFGGLGVN